MLVFLPRSVPHVFANLSDEEVWTVGLLNPPGLEQMFREQATYFESLQGPPGGRAATGRRVAWHQVHIFRLQVDVIVEHWAVRDDLRVLEAIDAAG